MLAHPRRYGFFQAVRLLEFCHPGAVPLGTAGPAAAEVLRLRPSTTYEHPRSSVTELEQLEPSHEQPRRFRVTEALIGLYGLRSPMPSVLGEEILQRSWDPDPVREFLDLFHHRALSLMYRAWAQSRAEAVFREDGSDMLTWILLCLIGAPSHLQPASRSIDPLQLTRYAQLFVRRARPAEGLEALLGDVLAGTAVRLEPYAPRHVNIPSSQRNRLGRSCSTLGADVHIGGTVFDLGTRFRLWIGPLHHDAYLDLAPGGRRREEIAALINLYVGDALSYDVQLGIPGEEKPACRLVRASGGVRLGVNAWLYARTPQQTWERFPALPDDPHTTTDGVAA